jgi:hypothetical protein
METLKKYWWVVLVLALGFVLGRWQTTPKIKVEYIKGETKTDTIYSKELVPYEVLIPAKPVLPMKPDTVIINGKTEYKYYKVDTAAIIADYIKLNKYSKTLFDNGTEGKLVVGAEVQYNKLNKLDYSFTPMQKQTTITKQRLITPFLSVSYNTFGYGGAGGGVYLNNVGIGLKYLSNLKGSGYEFGLNYKF